MKEKCPFCGGRVYRSTARGKHVYKCNDLTDESCPFAQEAIARTKPQLRMLKARYNDEEILGLEGSVVRSDRIRSLIDRLRESELHFVRRELHEEDDKVEKTAEIIADKLEEYVQYE